MSQAMTYLNLIIANYQVICAAILGILTGLIVIFQIIPGDQPEKALQAAVDFISKFSAKPAAKTEEKK